MNKPSKQKQDDTLEILQGLKADPKEESKTVVYNDDELKFRSNLINRLNQARDEREQNHTELDGMTYTQYYESNRKKDLSYIPPKQNKADIRIVTGTTREKSTTLLSTLLNLDLEPSVTAFDQDDMVISNLGIHTADLVKKSREIEEYWKNKSVLYREFLSQGDVFAEEYYCQEYIPVPVEENKEWNPATSKIADFKNPQFVMKKSYDSCKLRMIKGTKVYLGSVRVENIEDQDMVAILNVYSKDTAEAKYGTWDRWKFVPDTVDNTVVPVDENNLYKDWNLTRVPKGNVAELRIYLPKQNRFMVMLNGVMMLPIDYPMQAVAPARKTPVIQGKNEPISGFAYSKSVPSKTKVDQEMLDEFIKLMFEKMRQGARPSMGHIGKNIVNPSVLYSGKITSNMKENQLFPILPDTARTITNSDFSFYKLVRESIEEKTVNAVYSGQSPQGQTTATEINSQRNQQMLKLGLTLDGIVNFEKQAVWHRIYNIYANWTKPVDTRVDDNKETIKKVYRSLTLETDIEDEQKGYKIFKFDTPDNFPDEYSQYKEEVAKEKEMGRPVRMVYLNPEELCLLKIMFFVTIIPSDKSNSELSQVIFVQNVREAIELFGPDSLNLDHIKQRYAIKINENYEKWFKPQDELAQMEQMEADLESQQMQGGGKKVIPKKMGQNNIQPTMS